jgi:hypothetical protein
MENNQTINVRYPKEVVEFIKMNGNMVYVDGIRYYQPAQFWYTQAYLGDETVFTVHREIPNYIDNGKQDK